jgi:hypothetical protein
MINGHLIITGLTLPTVECPLFAFTPIRENTEANLAAGLILTDFQHTLVFFTVGGSWVGQTGMFF